MYKGQQDHGENVLDGEDGDAERGSDPLRRPSLLTGF